MQPEELPKLKKVLKPKEEPKKEEVKRTKVKVSKPKKYEDLPEIPDYERPELEVYEESEFDPSKATKSVDQAAKVPEVPVMSMAEADEPTKNGLPKVRAPVYPFALSMNYSTITGLLTFDLCAPIL